MQLINFFQKNWNILIIAAGVIVTIVSKFAIPPKFTTHLIYSEVDYDSFAKFIVAGCIGLFLIPATFLKERKHVKLWSIVSVILFIAAFALQFVYFHLFDEKTVWEEDSQSRYVIGDTYKPEAKKQIDSFAVANPKIELTPSLLIAGMDGAENIWPQNEIVSNLRSIIFLFITTVIAYALFVMSLMQALYCASIKRSAEKKKTE